MQNKEITLMYSGGLDTTYAAIQLAREYDKVHLLTFCNGFCVRPHASKRHVCILKGKFGEDKFEHSIISVKEVLSLFKKGLIADMLKIRSPLLFDLCCRLSMEVATIFYCLDKGITHATDGNNPDTQGEMFLQQDKYLVAVDTFFRRHNIQYVRPVRSLKSRDEVIKKLQEYGIETGIDSFKKVGVTTQLFTQPFCLWAPVAFLFTSRLRKIPFINFFGLSTEDAVAFRLKKEELAADIINYFKVNRSIVQTYPCKKEQLSKFLRRKC